jgi:Ca-activated chloride channel homolog
VKPVLPILLGLVAPFIACATFTAAALSPAVTPPPLISPKRAPLELDRWIGPRLILPSQMRNDKPIQLQTVRIAGDVNGLSATTEIDMTFFNPNNRVLEGELQFPLLDGQSIAGFAMDVNGKLRDAVPVEKAKGQQVFEDVIRGRIDPGLLEVTAGNNFKLRVYPLPANGTKRVVIRLAESLSNNLYRIPMSFGDKIGRLDLDIRVNGASAVPTLRGGPANGLKFSQEFFGKSGNHRLRETRNEFVGEGILEVGVRASTNELVQVENFDGKNYFTADIPLASREGERQIPSVVGIVWDSSASARTRDRAREFALLEAYFQKMRIRDVAEKTETFRIRNGEWNALRDVLQNTPYDGATNLGAFVPESNVREYLLFSDGLSNYGEKAFAQMSVPLYSVSAALKSDSVFLRHVAERSGGRSIDLTAVAAQEAARSLLNISTRVTRVESSGASELLLASPFAQSGRVQVAGIFSSSGSSSSATLQLTLQHPDGKTDTINANLGEALPSTAAAMRWAMLKVNTLDAEYNLNRAEIRRLGQRFRLVTRETSLIVLDLVQDYARFEIAPPAELRDEFDRITSQMASQQRMARGNHLEQIVRGFEQKVKWWNHDFPKNDFYQEKNSRAKERLDSTGRLREQSATVGERGMSSDEPARDGATPSRITSSCYCCKNGTTGRGSPLLRAYHFSSRGQELILSIGKQRHHPPHQVGA